MKLGISVEKCWEKFDNKTYRYAFQLRIKEKGRCSAHCFEIDHQGSLCDVIAEKIPLCKRQEQILKYDPK